MNGRRRSLFADRKKRRTIPPPTVSPTSSEGRFRHRQAQRLALVLTADVFVGYFRPGVAARHGLDYDGSIAEYMTACIYIGTIFLLLE